MFYLCQIIYNRLSLPYCIHVKCCSQPSSKTKRHISPWDTVTCLLKVNGFHGDSMQSSTCSTAKW